MSGRRGPADVVQLRCSRSCREEDWGEKGIQGEGRQGKRRGGVDWGGGVRKRTGKREKNKCMLIDV